MSVSVPFIFDHAHKTQHHSFPNLFFGKFLFIFLALSLTVLRVH